MDEMVIKGLYIELLKAMLHNIEEASTERAHNHIKLMFALSELTGLRSQRLDIILPKWQTLARACWKALSGPVLVQGNDLDYVSRYTADDWNHQKDLCQDFLSMFQATDTH